MRLWFVFQYPGHTRWSNLVPKHSTHAHARASPPAEPSPASSREEPSKVRIFDHSSSVSYHDSAVCTTTTRIRADCEWWPFEDVDLRKTGRQRLSHPQTCAAYQVSSHDVKCQTAGAQFVVGRHSVACSSRAELWLQCFIGPQLIPQMRWETDFTASET